MNRRAYLKAAAVAAMSPLRAQSNPTVPAITMTTHTYKVAQGCEIHADVYGYTDGVVRPVMIWIHGGALIIGDRSWIDRLLWYVYQQAGFVIVSIDYRLAPETKLPDIVQDLRDAYAWVREKGPALFRIDPARIAVSGESAGGYLTLMSGFRLTPPPKVLVSFWGYGDIIGNWYSRPDPFYSKMPAVSKEQAYKSVGNRVIAAAPKYDDNRRDFYLYCRQQGLWPLEVAGRDPRADPKWFDPYCPLRNVSAKYPPTMLVHGQEDTDVPHQQSSLMAQELRRAGVENEFISLPGVGHSLDGAGLPAIADTYVRVAGFLQRHV